MPNFKKVAAKVAKQRISFLFQAAEEIFPEDPQLAHRYVDLARKYSQRTKVKIPKKWKRRVCHNCHHFLYPGKNCRIRMQSRKGKGSHISVTCLDCNHTTRYFIDKKKKF
ncbi:MAG: ribonuclease P [Promethearchaeota archaeon]|nr:MAG: ribonuclease P [Candidatus Lokiarchaeota archaeon]